MAPDISCLPKLCTSTVPLYTLPFIGPLSGTIRVSRYQKRKSNLDFTEARDSEWQWHPLGPCKSAPRSRQITTPAPHHSIFLQAGCPSCRSTNSIKAWKAPIVDFYCSVLVRELLGGKEYLKSVVKDVHIPYTKKLLKLATYDYICMPMSQQAKVSALYRHVVPANSTVYVNM